MATECLERPLTYEEERGKPMPSLNHSLVQTNLILEFARQREYRVASELTLQLGSRSYIPDLSVYRRDGSRGIDCRHDIIRMVEVPLVAVEIYSPTQGSQEVMDKVDVYFEHGIQSCWIVSTPIHNITILTPDGQRHSFSTGVAKDPVCGLTADLETVFS